MKQKSVMIIVACAMVLVAAFGALTFRTVSAQDDTPATPTQPAPTQPRTTKSDDRGLRGVTEEDLASALGITVEELQTAQQTAQEAALKQAVDAGLLTQEQADQLAARGSGHFGFGRMMKNSQIDTEALFADALGITVEELQSARQTALTTALDRAVAAGTITQEQADLMVARQALAYDEAFQSNLRSAYETALQQAVTDGVITQAQADALLAQSSGRFFEGMGGFGSHHGFGGGRGGRHGGQFLDPSDSDTTPETPADTTGA